MSESPQSLFDAWAQDYETMRDEVDWDPFVHIEAAFGAQSLEGLSILDAGCGTGDGARWFQSRGALPYGLDISPEMCFVAAEKSENIPFLNHDLKDPLPFEASRFDAVVALGCLEYLSNIAQTVREFARVLRPGATFLACFERRGQDCPNQTAARVTFFEDWVRYRQTEEEVYALLKDDFTDITLCRVPGFKLTDDAGNETGERTQYIRVIAHRKA